MDRRTALRLLALPLSFGAGCLAGLPRATGPRTSPTPGEERSERGGSDLGVASLDIEETDGGNLRVVGTVENRGETSATRTVVVTVTVGDETHRRTAEVTVAGGATADFAVVFDVRFDAFTGNGTINARLKG